MDEKETILKALFDEKILQILQVFFEDDEKQYYLRELAKITGVSPATTYRILKRLLTLRILEKTEIKNLKIYKLKSTETTEFLKKVLYTKPDPLSIFVEKIKTIPQVELVVMHAKPQKSGAFVMIVGEDIPKNIIDEIDLEIANIYDYKIKILPLIQDLYEGLDKSHSGYKKVLFRRQN
ncbi:helix-turn-helix domain-containing protein [Candidatus Woesearchaeota archaeon]|nr:helix-turn-helix domain-containing protein [Candidatus Woesearchaeota archaeon]